MHQKPRSPPMWTPTEDQIDRAAQKAQAAREALAATVDAERDRRTALGFAFGGKTIQSRPDDLLKITGAATAAGIAVTVGGKLPGDLRWSDPDADFVWIAADNSTLAMDAPTTIQFGQAAL
ncbi:MAG TPA: DUF4376 domain-containing protein, partial [Pseudolabrys sp.]|nr:DUF4376 domain-containing protein [Pseudolabrys sp.]